MRIDHVEFDVVTPEQVTAWFFIYLFLVWLAVGMGFWAVDEWLARRKRRRQARTDLEFVKIHPEDWCSTHQTWFCTLCDGICTKCEAEDG